jgi:AcrR family transcriptional regulator
MRITNDAKEATRRRILDTARRLFARDGFDAAATRDLAQQAGIAAGTLFNYFPTKEALVVALAAEALQSARDAFDGGRRGESVEEDLFTLVATALRHLELLRGYLRPVLEGALSPLAGAATAGQGESIRVEHLETVGQVLCRHGQGELSFVTAHLYWALLCGVLAFWVEDGSAHQEDTLAVLDQAVKMFVRALPTPHSDSAGDTP